MHETPVSFLQVDAPAAGAVLPPGRHAVQGWLMPKLRGGFADLRVRVDGRVFPGLLGFPRADLAAHFATGRACELAGFQVDVELSPGPRRLVFEGLQVEGVWQEAGVLEVSVDGGLPAVDFPVPSAPVRGLEFGHLLHALLTAPAAGNDLPGQAHRLVAASPFPRDLLRPKPPFHGVLAAPSALVAAPDGLLEVRGHVFHAGARIRNVSASLDLQVRQPLSYGGPTPEVAAQHPRQAAAGACGYAGTVFVPAGLPNPVALRLHAELADGSVHLVHVARVGRRDADALTRPFMPALAARFEEAVNALRRALADHRLALVTDDVYRGEVARLFSLRAAPAPRRARPLRVDLEETFAHASAEQRSRLGLPVAGWIVSALAVPPHPALPALLAQTEHALRRRHPALAGTCRFSGDASDPLAALADLTVRAAGSDDEPTLAADPVVLAEAIARRLLRRQAAKA